jgi:hypothetical protein
MSNICTVFVDVLVMLNNIVIFVQCNVLVVICWAKTWETHIKTGKNKFHSAP